MLSFISGDKLLAALAQALEETGDVVELWWSPGAACVDPAEHGQFLAAVSDSWRSRQLRSRRWSDNLRLQPRRVAIAEQARAIHILRRAAALAEAARSSPQSRSTPASIIRGCS